MTEQDIRNRYMHGRCLDMASAIGRATGLPVMKLRRRNGALGHAFVVIDRHLPKSSWRCVDASGEMPLEAVTSNVEAAFGSVMLSRDETPATITDVMDDDVLAHARMIPHLAAILESHGRLSPDAPPRGFDPSLDDSRSIARYVVDLSPHDVDEQMVEETFEGCSAVLRWIRMNDIRPGHSHANIRFASRERTYSRMHPGSTPPILINDGVIEDGHHRHRVAIQRGDPGMWCYVIEEEHQR